MRVRLALSTLPSPQVELTGSHDEIELAKLCVDITLQQRKEEEANIDYEGLEQRSDVDTIHKVEVSDVLRDRRPALTGPALSRPRCVHQAAPTKSRVVHSRRAIGSKRTPSHVVRASAGFLS